MRPCIFTRTLETLSVVWSLQRHSFRTTTCPRLLLLSNDSVSREPHFNKSRPLNNRWFQTNFMSVLKCPRKKFFPDTDNLEEDEYMAQKGRIHPLSFFFLVCVLYPIEASLSSFPLLNNFFFPNHYFGFFSFLSHKYARTFEKYLHNTKAACLQKAYPMLYKGSDQQFPPPLIMTRYRGNDGNVYSSENVVSTERDLLGKML